MFKVPRKLMFKSALVCSFRVLGRAVNVCAHPQRVRQVANYWIVLVVAIARPPMRVRAPVIKAMFVSEQRI